MRVALVYDWVYTFGGAERILLALHKIFPDAPLYTSVYQKNQADWASQFEVKTTFLQLIPLASTHHYLFPLFTPVAFETLKFDSYDIVISVTSADAKGIITKPGTLHICYVLTPTRYIWSAKSAYFQHKITQKISAPFIKYLRKWDLIAKSRPDYLIAVSKTVKNRINKYYEKDCELIYPPVNINKFKINKIHKNPDYYLIVSRLIPYKRIDIAIQACNYLNRNLVIVGSGRDHNRLKKIAGSKIKFAGNLTDHQLISYYQNCRAVIITSEEDLGLVAIEAQAAGKPVIAFASGGVTETVIAGKTGIFFSGQNKNSLIETIKKFESNKYLAEKCLENSQNFSEEIFLKKFRKQILKYYENYNFRWRSRN